MGCVCVCVCLREGGREGGREGPVGGGGGDGADLQHHTLCQYRTWRSIHVPPYAIRIPGMA
eukprot:2226728-Rhodomonas_salina.1